MKTCFILWLWEPRGLKGIGNNITKVYTKSIPYEIGDYNSKMEEGVQTNRKIKIENTEDSESNIIPRYKYEPKLVFSLKIL